MKHLCENKQVLVIYQYFYYFTKFVSIITKPAYVHDILICYVHSNTHAYSQDEIWLDEMS